mmetsp:Transcript_9152/g.10570  ORF Transcript_9152/g.10570 Transcript_9152/m.10570 type:complete len:335 (-) Transcript_9152:546-1550(-)
MAAVKEPTSSVSENLPSMSNESHDMARPDPVWAAIRAEVKQECKREPLLTPKLHTAVLSQRNLEGSLAYMLANMLTGFSLSPAQYIPMFYDAMENGTCERGLKLGEIARKDLIAVKERDPACPSYSHALLFFKGFLGLQAHRVSHWMWRNDRKMLASLIQSRVSLVCGMDLHPAAKIGYGLMIDHATGIVIGETAVLGDGCSLLHGVTLGGTGKENGDRHPKIGSNVTVGAMATILGNITVGDGSKVAACSVVVKPVPAGVTVAGVPAKVVGGEKAKLLSATSAPAQPSIKLETPQAEVQRGNGGSRDWSRSFPEVQVMSTSSRKKSPEPRSKL